MLVGIFFQKVFPKRTKNQEILLFSSQIYIISNVQVCSPPLQITLQLWPAVEGVVFYSNSFIQVKRILASLVKGWSLRAAGLNITAESLGEPTAPEPEKAETLILLSTISRTWSSYYDKMLDILRPVKKGNIMVTNEIHKTKAGKVFFESPFIYI